MITQNTPGHMPPPEKAMEGIWTRWLGYIEHSSSPLGSNLLQALLSKAPPNHLRRLLYIFAFVCANSTAVYGSPVLVSRDDTRDDNKRSFVVPLSIGITVAVVLLLACGYYAKDRSRMNRPQGSLNNLRTNNQSHSPLATGTRTRQRPQRRPSQISTYSLPEYAKEPGESEQVLSGGIATPLTTRILPTVGEEAGTPSVVDRQSQRASSPESTDPPSLENHAANGSSLNPFAHSHEPSGNTTASGLQTSDSHDSGAPNPPGLVPPPYVQS